MCATHQKVPASQYHVKLRVQVPIELEQAVSDQLYAALGARKSSPWLLVRALVRKGNFAIEASGRRVGARVRTRAEMNPFELALDQMGMHSKALPVEVVHWQHEREPRTLYLTCGDDSILRGWDALERRCVVTNDLGYSRLQGCLRRVRRRAVCMCISPIGPEADQWLSIGYRGGQVSMHALSALTGAPLVELADRQEDITDLKFSPAGNILAVASGERTIDLYAKWFAAHELFADDNDGAHKFVMQRVGVCTGHSSAVMHMDFSDDGVYLRSNDASGQILCWSILDPNGAGHTIHSVNPDKEGKTKIVSRDLAAARHLMHKVSATVDPSTGLKNQRLKDQGSLVCGKIVERGSVLRDADWATHTCPMAWSVRAIWRPRAVAADISSISRSWQGDVVACGYKPVKLNLGTITDAMSAKEEAAAKYNLVSLHVTACVCVFVRICISLVMCVHADVLIRVNT